jgi:uncharacterized membrane protein YvbJ
VPEFCTCGARLPEDARFCHKCGKPQRDEPTFQSEIEVPVAIPAETAPPPPPPAINLRNGIAVRSALAACVLTVLLAFLLNPLGLSILAMVIGGFVAVLLYRRRTGQPLSVWSGMRLGWISGVFAFILVMLATTLLVAVLSDATVAAQLREQMIKTYPAEEVAKLFETLQSPAKVGLLLLDAFVSSTLLMGLGAAAGAKFLDRR